MPIVPKLTKQQNQRHVKGFVGRTINVDLSMKLVIKIVENIVGKGGYAEYQHFSFSHNV